MLIGARTAAFSSGNQEEEMYKELFINLVARTDQPIDFVNYDITTVGKSGFTLCGYNSVTLPNCASVGESGFSNSKIKSLNLSGIINIPNHQNTFSGSGEIELMNFENVKTIGGYSFQNNHYLKDLYIPNVVSISNSAFGRIKVSSSINTVNIHINKTKEQIKSMSGFPFLAYQSETNYSKVFFVATDGILSWNGSEWV